AIEAARWVSQRLSEMNPQVRAARRRAAAVLVTDKQTQRWLSRMPGPSPILFPGIGVAEPIESPAAAGATRGGAPLRLLWVSRLIPYKGLPLLLRALAQVGDRIEYQ